MKAKQGGQRFEGPGLHWPLLPSHRLPERCLLDVRAGVSLKRFKPLPRRPVTGGAFGVTRGSPWLRPLPWRQVMVRASPWTSRAVGTGAFCWPSRPAVGLRCVGQKGPGSLRQPVGLVQSLTIHPAELSSAYKRGGDDTASSPRGWQGWTRR